jgi:sugar phosphate isomerase/epimerase
MQIAINTACYIGRQTGYALRPFAWGPARSATVAAFSGPGFADQLAQLAATIRGLGVSNVELWSAHLSPSATPTMVEQAGAIFAAHGLRVAAYAASLRRPGLSPGELGRTFEIARTLGAPVIAGGLHHAYAASVHALCREHHLRFAVENHPEDDPMELLAQIDGREDWFGVALDTGWFRTNGGDVLAAIATLRQHLVHVHLKDVRSIGLPHRTCPLGEGVAGVSAILTALQQAGYRGMLSIEHEPPHHDPTEDLRVSVQRVQGWLAANLASSPAAM